MDDLFDEEPPQPPLKRYALVAVYSNGRRELLSDCISSEDGAKEQGKAWLDRLKSFSVEVVEISIPMYGVKVEKAKE